ncbi:MAG TPA: ubiquitin-like small modifier protein 1 [Planctomycetota bacterium]|nr:ubiquitin-like small modifier protein 1 [Planctomycetota bacterium]
MNVNFYAMLREIAGRKTVALPLRAGATVHELLDAVIERFPAMRESLFDEHGQLYGHVHVFINGQDAPYLEHGLETRLTEGDAIDLFPAVGGG